MSKEQNWNEDICSELANRIMNSYQTMHDAFQRIGSDPINRPSGERQTMRYNTVRATSMHSAFVILEINAVTKGLNLLKKITTVSLH